MKKIIVCSFLVSGINCFGMDQKEFEPVNKNIVRISSPKTLERRFSESDLEDFNNKTQAAKKLGGKSFSPEALPYKVVSLLNEYHQEGKEYNQALLATRVMIELVKK